MTTQVKDKIHFINNEENGTLEILQGSEKLLNLRDYSINPSDKLITSSYRGYMAEYIIEDNQLILDNLKLNFNIDSLDFVKNAENRVPNKDNDSHRFRYNYANINHPTNYSGKLLVGYGRTGFLPQGYYSTIAEWNAYYANLIELELSSGKIINHKVLDKNSLPIETQGISEEEFTNIRNLIPHRRKHIKDLDSQDSSED